MAPTIAARLARIRPSATIAVSMKAAALRAAGRDVISLAAGEPDFPTPAHVRAAAIEAVERGETKYTAVDGTPAVKAAVARKYAEVDGLAFEPDEIIVSSGAKQCIFNLLKAIIDPCCEVLIPAPCWVSYPDMTALAGGRATLLATSAATRFRITPEQLDAAIGPETRLLMLNAPANPTGQTYSAAELADLAAVLRRHPQVAVACDDIYEYIHWGEEPLKNLLAIAPDLRERTVLVNGVSKAYAMTGWRIGYAAGPAPVIAAMRKVQGQSTSNPCSVSQAAAVAALEGPQDCVRAMTAEFRARHDFLVGALNALDGVTCLPADGAFYAFASFADLLGRRPDLPDDVALAEALLEDVGVAAVPGTAFAQPQHLRFSYATSRDQLEEAARRLADFVAAG